MNVFNKLQEKLEEVLKGLQKAGALPEELSFKGVAVEPPRDKSHGDIAINAALVLAKQAKMNPRQLGDIIAAKLNDLEGFETVEVGKIKLVKF